MRTTKTCQRGASADTASESQRPSLARPVNVVSALLDVGRLGEFVRVGRLTAMLLSNVHNDLCQLSILATGCGAVRARRSRVAIDEMGRAEGIVLCAGRGDSFL
jgi:hypothetical protein